MATLTERVLALSNGGMTFPVIAAVLNVTPAQVEEAFLGTNLPGGGGPGLAEPRWLAFDANLPSNPAGSAIGIEASIPIFPADLWEPAPYAYGTADSSLIIAPAGAVAIHFNNVILQQGRGNDTVTPKISGVILRVAGEAEDWCRFRLSPPALTVAASEHLFVGGDLEIISQSAADFSVVGSSLKTAAGGRFACTVAFEATGALDA